MQIKPRVSVEVKMRVQIQRILKTSVFLRHKDKSNYSLYSQSEGAEQTSWDSFSHWCLHSSGDLHGAFDCVVVEGAAAV